MAVAVRVVLVGIGVAEFGCSACAAWLGELRFYTVVQAGQVVHNGPEWGEHLDSLGYAPGRAISPDSIPDGFTDGGFPVELKPDTRSGIKAGTRQLRRYMNEMGVDYGELWTYTQTPDGVSFRLAAMPKSPYRWFKW
ncbi:hypothetical protein [Actinoallomurus iriomotensis]|uniref:hypothetical protein n=1 Tax=Actinoallomurus iriomotensis TaxID=478107 RepID=UPI0025567FCE|nr:hypothetical protein [Actinoallomurus iriomotensis]